MVGIDLQLLPVLPEIFVATMACLILVVDLYLPERHRYVTYWACVATLVVAALMSMAGFSTVSIKVLNGMFVDDALSDLVKVAVYLVTIAVYIYSREYIRARDFDRGEYYVLGLFGVVGMMVMASASHFLTLYLGLELLSLCLYTMVAFQRDSVLATEASMKYFVLGSLASGILLYGMSIVYGLTGTLAIDEVRVAVATMSVDSLPLILGLVFIVAGLMFKVGAVPFHMWIPDVYHGAPTSTTAYLGAAPKLAGFAIIVRLLVGGLEDISGVWQQMLIATAVLSIVVGNVVAIAQANIKRMLAYSTISHMGFFLLGILSATDNGYSSALFYVLIYVFMSIGAFGIILLLSRHGFEADQLDDLRGLNQKNPWYALLMLLLMFSMAGVPPTVGFYAKLSVIQAVLEAGLVWLAVIAVLFAVVGAFYYLRIVKLMYFDNPVDQARVHAPIDARVIIGINGLAVIAVMPWVGFLFELCNAAIGGLSYG